MTRGPQSCATRWGVRHNVLLGLHCLAGPGYDIGTHVCSMRGHLESKLKQDLFLQDVPKSDLQNFDTPSLNKVEPNPKQPFLLPKEISGCRWHKRSKNFVIHFFRISCSSLFMVLTIALVPIIARTHTNISFVILFSLLTTTPFSQGFLCHHTGACQSSSYDLSTSNTHGRAIPRNHGFLEVAFP